MDQYTADVSRFGDGIAVRIEGPMTQDDKREIATRLATAACRPGVEGCMAKDYSASHGFLFEVTRGG